MAMNPAALLKVHQMIKGFEERHPRVVSFGTKELLGGNIPEGTVFELSLTRPGENTVTTNMKITAEDLEMLRVLKDLKG